MHFYPGNQTFHVLRFHWFVSCRIRIMRGKLQRLDNLPPVPHILLPTFLSSGFHSRLQLYSRPAVYELMSAVSLSHTLWVTLMQSPPHYKVPIRSPRMFQSPLPLLSLTWNEREADVGDQIRQPVPQSHIKSRKVHLYFIQKHHEWHEM